MTGSPFRSRTALIVPLVLLVVALLEDIAMYKLRQHVRDIYLRTGLILVLTGVGFAFAAGYVGPWLQGVFSKARKGSKSGAGKIGIWVFDVTVDRDHLRSVRVLHGRVEVRAYGAAPKLLAAGERWEVQLASAEPAPEPAPEPIVIDEPAPAPVGTHSPRQAPSRSSIATQVAREERAPARPSAPSPQQQVTAKQPVQQLPARAKRPIELLFDEGWSTLQAGNAAAAATLFERAVASAPNDPLAEDAWFWRASALSRAKSASAASVLDAFLAKYPRSPRAGEASAMLGWLILDRDLDRAEALFRAAEHDRVAAVRASAAKGLAAVAQRRTSQ